MKQEQSRLIEQMEQLCNRVTINTHSMEKKKEYLHALLRHYNGKIPIADVLDKNNRAYLANILFGKNNEHNYVLYPICAGLSFKALGYDYDCIILKNECNLDQ